MSSLTDSEKRYFERLFDMDRGHYVLDYTNASYQTFFKEQGVNIYDAKYETYGDSKAKRLRAFWEVEPDILVGRVLSEMLDSYETGCALNIWDFNELALKKARKIVSRLTGESIPAEHSPKVNDSLRHEFEIPNISGLPIAPKVIPIIESRLEEARITLQAGAYLSVIFLCGSALEAALLGAAQKEPARFNRAKASPKKRDGSVKPFGEWTLAQFIDVAYEIDMLKLNVRKFGHELRNFRNFIHPYQQVRERFSPDKHTAKMCFQALEAALSNLANNQG